MQKYSKRAWVEIHLDRLERNYNACKNLLKGDTELMAVVKADAYGHGEDIVAPFLQELGVKWFAVSNIMEAENLLKAGIKGGVLILGYVSPDEVKYFFEAGDNIIQTVTSFEYAKQLSENIPEGKKLKVHIKIDTGMGRIGLKHNEVSKYVDEIEKIMNIENIDVDGMFTHLSVADSDEDEDVEYTKNQCELIKNIEEELKSRDIVLNHVHFLNSAGATYHGDERSSFARFGIMLYGLHPNSALEVPVYLEPVMEFKAVVSHVKTIEKGESVSYGRTFKATQQIKVASLAVGYADGYSRLLSSKGEVLANGKRAKVIGRVCMDQTMIDVTGIDIEVGDVVTMFGTEGKEKISADDVAEIYGTIGYEVVCGITKRVPRVFLKHGKLIEVVNY